MERLGGSAGLLDAVEHRDPGCGGRQRPEERLRGEGAVEPNRHDADLLAAAHQLIDDLGRGTCAGAHEHDDAIGIGSAVVVHERVAATGALGQLVEHLLDDGGHCVMEGVGRLAGLEEHVGVLCAAPEHRSLRGEPTRPVVEHVGEAHERPQVLVIEQRDLVDLVRGAEAVEEVQEGHP